MSSTEPGPWASEPDHVEWTDTESGLECRIVRHPGAGHLCGYVQLPADHPWHGRDYDDIDVEVHGGLTYAQDRFPRQDDPGPGWVIGFDCAHLGDLSPFWDAPDRGVYRDVAYVRDQCAGLAAAACAAAVTAGGTR